MFMPNGAQKLVRKTTRDAKKLKAIAELLGVADAENVKSATVELSMGEGGQASGGKGASKGSGKGSATKTAGKKGSASKR
jgi:hypothetical protein